MPKSKSIEDYFPIQITDLKPGEPLAFDLHLYFAKNHHLMLWREKGSIVTDGFLDKYVSRGIRELWLHRDDAENFKSYLEPPAPGEGLNESELEELSRPPVETAREINEVMQSSQMSMEEKQAVVGGLAQTLVKQAVLPSSQRAQTHTNQQLRNAVSEMLDNILDGTRDVAKQHISEIWKIANIDPDFEHAVNVSTFAVIFAMAFGRIDSTLLGDLALAGLLHDVGLCLIPASLTTIPWKSFTRDQLKIYAKHVELGTGIIEAQEPGIPPRVRAIIGQHHEKFDGSGYPMKLSGFKVDDISQLLAIADILDSFASGQWDGVRRTLHDTFDMLERLEKSSTFPEYFNPDIFAAVIGWIRSRNSQDARKGAVAVVEAQTRSLLREAK